MITSSQDKAFELNLFLLSMLWGVIRTNLKALEWKNITNSHKKALEQPQGIIFYSQNSSSVPAKGEWMSSLSEIDFIARFNSLFFKWRVENSKQGLIQYSNFDWTKEQLNNSFTFSLLSMYSFGTLDSFFQVIPIFPLRLRLIADIDGSLSLSQIPLSRSLFCIFLA